ncbi:MAG: sigma 54-interacting transcriptional regulator [Desulfuromonadaceae bacterium]|nr:sigma 54-interacting transcriptional regulator [Desulfuromonadaceae bacterium]
MQLPEIQEIRTDLQHLQTILDSVSDGVFTVDNNMCITLFNRGAENITGVPREKALGQPCCEIFRTNACFDNCPLRQAIVSGKNINNREVTILDQNNREIPISVNAAVLLNLEGEVIGGVETFRDLSQLHALSEEFRKKFIFQDMISRNHKMQQLFDIIPDVAASDVTVLLQGESGTGKELFARALHNLSARTEAPLVVINCGALPEQLLEAEFFGVRKGAYTGAVMDRQGRLVSAEGGTLFLDEIGDLPLSLQVKLLRVLENREYQPLGSDETKIANVRFITATHHDLAELVEQKRFRRDLFYRLNIVTLKIPPLHERQEDIPLLLDISLERFCKKHGKRIHSFSPEALERLLTHQYTGNVRELINIVERAVVLCRSTQIKQRHLPPSPEKTDPPPPTAGISAAELSQLLLRFGGRKSQISKHLGIDRTTLWRWLKKHNLG